MRNIAVSVFCLLTVLCTVPVATADTVYINGGYYVVATTGDTYRFQVGSGPDALVTGSAPGVQGISALSCYVCDPGSTYQIGRHTAGGGFLGEADLGSGAFASESSSSHFNFSGWLTFLADPITLPANGTSEVSYDIPFRARVSLDGSDIDHPGGGIFARWLGMGTAHVRFTPTADGRWRNDSGEMLRYDFSSEPVPEPATMFLLGTGLAGLAATRARRLRR